MIRFDNGPPGGDYVRYIDELMAQRAAALVSATMTSSSDQSSQRAAPLSPAAAAAIASAIMTGDNPRRAAPVGTFIGAVAIAIGAVLILMGILGTTSNVLLIVTGIALVSWAIKRLGSGVTPPAAAPAVDMFATTPTLRTSSHIGNKRK